MNRLGQLRKERETWRVHWAEITQYLLPRNGRYFLQDRDRGWRRHNNIFDNTATRALNTLAAGMMSGMTSPARPWFRFGTMDPTLVKQSRAAKIWLNQTTQIVLDIFARGNTYRALHAIYKELGAFGTAACVGVDDFNDVMRQYNLTVGEFMIAQDWRGNVDTVYREFEKTVAEIVREFGRENCSETVKHMYDSGQYDTWIGVVQAIEPRRDRDPRKKDQMNMAWRSVYLERGATGDKLLRESGFKYFPSLAPRWDLAGGDIYGNSPGMESLGDIKQLQQEQLRKSQAIDYQTKPPLQLPTAMKNREVDALPGGVSYFDTQGKTTTRNLFQVQLDLQHLLMDIQDVRQRIDQTFYKDLFLMLATNTRDERMTATEVAERHEEKLLMLGPVLERLNDELLGPLVNQALRRAIEFNMLPPMPPELHDEPLNVEYVSMLAQAQQAVATTSMDRYVQSIGSVAALKPEVLDNIDVDHYAEAYADALGIDPEMLVPGRKVALVRKARADAQAKAQQAQASNMQADTAKKLAQAQTRGGQSSMLDDVINQFQGYGAPEQVGAGRQ